MQPAMTQYFQMLQLQQPAWMYSLMAFSHFAKETAKVHFWRMTLPLFIYSRYFLFYSKDNHDVYLNFKWIEMKILEINMMLSGKTKYSKCYTMQRNPVILDILKSLFLQHAYSWSLFDCSVFSDWISGPKGQTNSWNWKQNGTSCLRPSIWKVLAYLRSQNPLHSFSTIVQLWCLPLVTVLFT